MNPATSRQGGMLPWALALAALLLLVLWSRGLWAGYLVAGAVAFGAAAVAVRRQPASFAATARRHYLLGMVLLGTGLLVGGVAHWRFELIEFRWDHLRAAREAQLAADVAARMDELREAGSNAAAAAAATAADPEGHRQLFQRLNELRGRTGVDALAVFSRQGNPVAWSGEHRGAVPDSVEAAERRFYFEERPLFSYLYFIQPVPGRSEYAVAAILIETALTEESDAGQEVASPVAREVTFHTAHQRTVGRQIWALTERNDTVVRALLRPVSQAERRAEVERLPRLLTLVLALTAFVAFAFAFLTVGASTRAYRSLPLLALLLLLAVVPAGETLGLRSIFLPSYFALPGDLTLGRLLLLLVPVAGLVAGLRRHALPTERRWLAALAGAAAVAIGYPGGLNLLVGAATRPLLEYGSTLWLALQFACVLLLTILTAVALPRLRTGPASGGRSRWRPWLAPLGALLAAVLGLLVATLVSPVAPTGRYAALWGGAFLLVALGSYQGSGRRAALRRWLFAGWLAISAAVPHLWVAQLNARIRTAEEELSTLSSRSNPYLFLALEEFGRQARARAYRGEFGVQLLYRTWVASGLARESFPVRITQWSPANLPRVSMGSYEEELTSVEARVLVELLDEARAEGSAWVYPISDQPHMSSVLAVPLPTGDVITVLVPPRRSLGRPTGAALFFGREQTSAIRNLIPALDPNAQPEPLRWQQARGGWRARSLVQYPDGRYYAHLLVRLPPAGVWLARAVIVCALDLALLLVIWGLSALARGASPWPRGGLAATLASFRARVTLALFGFFLIPTVGFGYAAYHALAQEVERATRVVAQRAANQAVREYPSVLLFNLEPLRALAEHANTDVLRFQGGELIEVSSREAFDLGIYSAWMPPLVYAQLQSGEEESVVVVQEFAGEPFVTAYNTVQPSGTLATPMPLVSGDIAIRQRELAHVIIFAAILGAMLSLALSVLVGRTLAGPIALLRRAAVAVGAGRLRVRLPEEQGGEFGQLFTSFNRMVRRLRRARARELRTARVLAWGEMARQVAHEIKNPLTPIKLSVQHIRRAHHDRRPEFGRILDGSVNEILREIDRLSDIARAFSRYGAPTLAAGPLEAVDLNAVIHEALTLYRAADDAVGYHADVEPGIGRVSARAGELKEVLLNLVENARTALRGQGTIAVRARPVEDRIEVAVSDDGAGIAPELLERVFDPHFSTHSSGTGLGLAIVRRLVESWHGTIAVESRLGEGTTVTVRLRPAPPATATAPGS